VKEHVSVFGLSYLVLGILLNFHILLILHLSFVVSFLCHLNVSLRI